MRPWRVLARPRAAPIAEILTDVRRGEFVVVVQGTDAAKFGYFVLAAQHADAKALEFLRRGAMQFILCLSDERCETLGLDPVASAQDETLRTSVTPSIALRDAEAGLAGAAQTIRAAIDPLTSPDELTRPGHVTPARVRPGGVLERAGSGEAAVDLARLAGLSPAAVVGRVNAQRHGFRTITIADVIKYRRQTDKLVERSTSVRLPTEFGTFIAVGFAEKLRNTHHIALVKGDVAGADDVLVGLHRHCFFGDLFSSHECECGKTLSLSLQRIEEEGRGVLLYLTSEAEKTDVCTNAAAINGLNGAEAGDYELGAQMLVDLGLSTIRLLTASGERVEWSEGFGLDIVETVPISR
jgi:3,4-dihydroxy 2-butanone 4-phosphate synthase / GTP cyclohydrolase II